MNQSPEAVVRGFFAEMGRKGSLISAVQNWCADECRWENSGLPTAENKKAMLAMMQGFIDGYQLDHIVIDLPSFAVSGDTVLTERVDHLNKADGQTVVSAALAGVLVVKNGKVVRWSDYFDPRPFLPA